MKKLMLLSIFVVLSFSFAIPVFAAPKGIGRPFSNKVVYVTSQNQYYDTIVPVTPDKGLPYKMQNSHTFQELEMTGPTGLQTEYGPGDPEYVGGRWWIDDNDNDQMDPSDIYFLCPLLGPGRETP